MPSARCQATRYLENRVKPIKLLGWVLFAILATSCGPAVNSRLVLQTATGTALAITPASEATSTLTPFPTLVPTDTSTPTPTATFTQTPTETETPAPTEVPSAAVSPTYAILRGEVLERSNCRYGPGAPYLYKYGLVVGSNLEVTGRTERGDWILVRAIGGNNPCWVKASLMAVKGDVMSVQSTEIPLPMSPYYGPLTGVSAARNGDEVAIFWHPMQLRAGDETASPLYLVEAWACVNGQLEFTPVGTNETAVKIIDQTGCIEPSHGRVYGVEKHGYTRWVKIPWPQHP